MTDAAPAPAAEVALPTDLLPEELTPEAAAARIVELKKDPAFIEKYLNGETNARGEFTKLHGLASNGGPVNPDGIHRSLQFDALRKLAPTLPEKCFAQAASNGPVFQHERDEALRVKESCLRDKSFVARYLDGSREETQLMVQIAMILASPVKTEGT